jgi:hypothetical protein
MGIGHKPRQTEVGLPPVGITTASTRQLTQKGKKTNIKDTTVPTIIRDTKVPGCVFFYNFVMIIYLKTKRNSTIFIKVFSMTSRLLKELGLDLNWIDSKDSDKGATLGNVPCCSIVIRI